MYHEQMKLFVLVFNKSDFSLNGPVSNAELCENHKSCKHHKSSHRKLQMLCESMEKLWFCGHASLWTVTVVSQSAYTTHVCYVFWQVNDLSVHKLVYIDFTQTLYSIQRYYSVFLDTRKDAEEVIYPHLYFPTFIIYVVARSEKSEIMLFL